MGDDKDKISVLPISGVLAIVAVLGVTIFSQPFRTSRPSPPDHTDQHAKVSARLWQDPFRAVLDSKTLNLLNPQEFNICEKNPERWKPPAGCLLSEDITVGAKNLTLLCVMVPGSPFAEDSETRMRYRYAVLSGLGRLGYVPKDAEHLEFIKIRQYGQPDGYALSNIIPMEWLDRPGLSGEKNSADRVLVLWLNDQFFEKAPLEKLDRLTRYMSSLAPLDRFRIIGPARSETLQAMVDEIPDKVTPSSEITGTAGCRIYSAMATIDDRALLAAELVGTAGEGKGGRGIGPSADEARKTIQKKFRTRGFEFDRTIGSDRRLARTLIDELRLRNVDLMNRETQILLIAEWDTAYGRSFEKNFREEIKEAILSDPGNKNISRAEVMHRIRLADIGGRIRRVSYMRGIDGNLSGKDDGGEGKSRKEGEKKSEEKSDALKDRRKLEQAVGPSQYDYLRRLSEEINRLSDDLRSAGKGEIKAVGVVGTDFYDKYLVLQALRPIFVDAVYFTVDMDARLLDAEHIDWTRNLVVASNFDLSLKKDPDADMQGEIPPFRDSYQTSIFFTILKVFSPEICIEGKPECRPVQNRIENFDPHGKPIVFEVGRRKAILLAQPEEDGIHPLKDSRWIGGWRVVLLSGCALVFLALTSTGINSRAKLLVTAPTGYRVAAWAGTVFGLVMIPLAIYYISGREQEEPFSLTEGISVWPAEAIRIVAIILSWVFFYRAYTHRRDNTKRIAGDFGLNPNPSRKFTCKIFLARSKNLACFRKWKWRKVTGWLRNIADLGWKSDEDEKRTLKDLWKAYVDRDRGLYRFWRVAIMAALFIALCAIIVSYDPPVSPVRGPISHAVDRGIIIAYIVSFVILVSYVYDVTTCCRRFISIASEPFEKGRVAESNREARERVRGGLELIRLIAERTAVIGKFIFYPFIIWLIIFISRVNYFDNWRIPKGLIVVLSLGAVYAWASALLLRLEAEKARRRVIGSFERMQAVSCGIDCGPGDLIENAINKIRAVRDGAFARLSQHPVLQVLLVPFGGIGGVLGIELLSKLNL